jgi:hypothetical protein
VELKGQVDNLFGFCPDVWFTVQDRLVHANDDTKFKKGDCKDLPGAKEVTVRGVTQTFAGRDYVQAQTIEVKK